MKTLSKWLMTTALWPQTTIATAAVEFAIDAELLKAFRSAAIMADAAWEILTSDAREVMGNCLVDEAVLRAAGVLDFDGYKADPTAEHVQLDRFSDP